jgi:hypothetical protein
MGTKHRLYELQPQPATLMSPEPPRHTAASAGLCSVRRDADRTRISARAAAALLGLGENGVQLALGLV